MRQAKKTAGRKASADAVRPMECLEAPATPCQVVMALASPGGHPSGELGRSVPSPTGVLRAAVSKTAPIAKAKRSKAVPMAPAYTSSRPKGAKGNMPSLQCA